MQKYANRHWKVNSANEDVHELHFTEFYDDEIIAILTPGSDEDPTIWNYQLKLDVCADDTFLTADSLEEAKKWIEEVIIEHLEDEIRRMKECIEKFKEEI